MLRSRFAGWVQQTLSDAPHSEGRQAYHSDIRALRPDAWSQHTPVARGRDIEHAMLLAGVTTRDFAGYLEIDLAPDLAAPVDDIVSLCESRARSCTELGRELSATLPLPNPWGRPPLPCHREAARRARELFRAAYAWRSLADTLISNRWQER